MILYSNTSELLTSSHCEILQHVNQDGQKIPLFTTNGH